MKRRTVMKDLVDLHVAGGRRLLLVACALLAGLAQSACINLPFDASTRANKPQLGSAPPATSASTTPPELTNGVFIGIAMSGGGSRAANFSAAALLELDRIGLLEHATVISSVSGSSLTAAYYGMYGRDKNRFSKEALQRTMIYDFDRDWIVRWLHPHNIVRYWLTPFDRSDIMKSVFDQVLFDEEQRQDPLSQRAEPYEHHAPRKRATFADLNPPGKTRILINATSIAGGDNFVFSDQSFEALGSRLDAYPLSHAVMASAAFPAAFNSVTLQDYRKEEEHRHNTPPESRAFYKHLYDGGPSGNLGLNTLKDMLHAAAKAEDRNRRVKECLLVLVDAFPIAQAKLNKGEDKRDLRSLLGYLVDDNLGDAFDDLLRSQRQEALRALGYPHDTPIGRLATWQYHPSLLDASGLRPLVCHVWHITVQVEGTAVDPQFEALKKAESQSREQARTSTTSPENEADLYRKALNIATDFRLINPATGDPKELQDVLFDAVHWRVKAKEDEMTELLRGWGLRGGSVP